MNRHPRAALAAFALSCLCACPAPPDDDDDVTLPTALTVDEGEEATLAVPAGTTVASASAGLSARVEGDSLVVRAALGAQSGVVAIENGDARADVDVTVRPLGFLPLLSFTDGPSAREHGAFLVDEAGASLFLLGGGGYPNFPTQAVFDDAWRLDLESGRWSAWDVSGDVPPPGASRRAAQAGNVAYLHGGYDGDGESLGDLYRVDLDSGAFTAVTQSEPAPSPRSLHAFAYDAAGAQLFVYGGASLVAGGFEVLDDTWLGELSASGDSVTWRQVTTTLQPPARYGMFAGYDPALRTVVMFSGAGVPTFADNVNPHDDVWTFRFDRDEANGGVAEADAWFDLFPGFPQGGAPPPGRRNGCGVVNTTTHELFVFGGTADAATTSPGAFRLDFQGNGFWRPVDDDAGAGVPPRRSSSFGVSLPAAAGGGIACGYGNDDALYRDVFRFGHVEP